jgi:hypothetical protein
VLVRPKHSAPLEPEFEDPRFATDIRLGWSRSSRMLEHQGPPRFSDTLPNSRAFAIVEPSPRYQLCSHAVRAVGCRPEEGQ